MKKKFLIIFLSLLFVLSTSIFTISCNNGGSNNSNKKDDGNKEETSSDLYMPSSEESGSVTLYLKESALELDEGETFSLEAVIVNSEGVVSWKSEDINVATVNNGLITAVKAGQTKITATFGEISASCVVKVVKSTSAPVLETNYSQVTIIKGEVITLSATLSWKGNVKSNVELSWNTTSSLVTLSGISNGNATLTANNAGEAEIIVSTTYNNIFVAKSIKVTILESGITSVQYVNSAISNLSNDYSEMLVSDLLSISTITSNYNALSNEDKAEITQENVEKLSALNNKLSVANWNIEIKGNILTNGEEQEEKVNDLTCYMAEDVLQNTACANVFDFSVFKEVYFAFKISGTDKPSFVNNSNTFSIELDKWIYVKLISCKDGVVMFTSDSKDSGYKQTKVSAYNTNSSIPSSISELLKFYNVTSLNTLSWKIYTVGIYTNDRADYVRGLVNQLPAEDKVTVNNWSDTYFAYSKASELDENEKASISTQITKLNAIYNNLVVKYNAVVESWGDKYSDFIPDQDFENQSMDSNLKFGEIDVYTHEFNASKEDERKGTKTDEEGNTVEYVEKIGFAMYQDGICINANDEINEFYMAFKSTATVKFIDTQGPYFTPNIWYILKIEKDTEAQYGGWKLSVRRIDEDSFTAVKASSWRVGNHEQSVYQGKAYIRYFFTFKLTSEDVKGTFSISATGLYSPHTFVVRHDAENHWEECPICGEKKNIQAYTAVGDYQYDETSHWVICSICGEKANVEGHIPSIEVYQDYENKKQYNLCTKCGVKVNETDHVHTYSIDKGNNKFACECGEEFESPFAGLTVVFDNILTNSTANGTMLGADKYAVTATVADSSKCPDILDGGKRLYYTDDYEEYYFAFKAGVVGVIRGTSTSISPNVWYLIKYTKDSSGYTGFNMWIKELYSNDDYVQVGVDAWRLGNHQSYNGYFSLSTPFSINTTNTNPFNVEMTGLYGKAPTQSDVFTTNNLVKYNLDYTIDSVESTETYFGKKVYTIADVPRFINNEQDGTIGKSGVYINANEVYNDEYYFAMRFNVPCHFAYYANIVFNPNMWYVFKLVKANATTTGSVAYAKVWNLYYSVNGTDFTKIETSQVWRFGDHASYYGRAFFNCFIVMQTEIWKAGTYYSETYTVDVTDIYSQEITHDHEYVQKSDATNHWQECSICGEKKDIEAHTQGSEIFYSASTQYYKCTVCGATMNETAHTHDYSVDKGNGVYACSGCGTEITNPLYGKNLVFSSILTGGTSTSSILGIATDVAEKQVEDSSNCPDILDSGKRLYYTDDYEEYYFAFKAGVVGVIRGTSTSISPNVWYLIKYTKDSSGYTGFKMWIKELYSNDDYVQVGVDAWRLGNHSLYNGYFSLSTPFSINTTNTNPFNVEMTGLYGKAPTMSNALSSLTKDTTSYTIDSVESAETFFDEKVYTISDVARASTFGKSGVTLNANTAVFDEYYFAARFNVPTTFVYAGNTVFNPNLWYIFKLVKADGTTGSYKAWNLYYSIDGTTFTQITTGETYRLGDHADTGYQGTAHFTAMLVMNSVVWSSSGYYSDTYTVDITSLYGQTTHEHTYVQKSDATNHWQECSICGEKKDIEAHNYTIDNGDGTVSCACGAKYASPFVDLVKDETKFWRSSGTQTVNNASEESTSITITTTEVTDSSDKYKVFTVEYPTYKISDIPSNSSLGAKFKSYSSFGNLSGSLDSTVAKASNYYFAVKFNVDAQLSNATTVTFSKDTWYIIKLEKKATRGWTMYYKVDGTGDFVSAKMDAWKLGDVDAYNGKAYYTTIFQINTVNGESTYTAYVTNYYREKIDSFVGLTKDETQFWRSSGTISNVNDKSDNKIDVTVTTTEVTDASSKYTVGGTAYTTYQIADVSSLSSLGTGASSYSSFGNISSCLDSTVAKASNYYFAVKFNVDVKTSNSTSFTFEGNTWYIIKLEKKTGTYGGWTMYYRTEEMENFVNVGFDAWRLGDNESLLGKAYYSTFLQMTTVNGESTYTAYVTNYYTDVTQ